MKRPQWLFKWIDDLNVRQLAIIAQVAGLIVTIVWVWLLIAAAVLAMLPASLGRILVLPGIWALPGLIVGRRRR